MNTFKTVTGETIFYLVCSSLSFTTVYQSCLYGTWSVPGVQALNGHAVSSVFSKKSDAIPNLKVAPGNAYGTIGLEI